MPSLSGKVKKTPAEGTTANVGVPKSAGKKKTPGDNYVLVGWDIDATGRKLIDEICQIAGYTPNDAYNQYVMPYRNLNFSSKKRHGLKVITITRFRMLKDVKANKIVATKSEVSALTGFLDWLSKIKGDSHDGVILMYHENQQVLPGLLLESLKRWNLFDRFKEIVVGFVNSCEVFQKRNKNEKGGFAMRTLARTLLDKVTERDNLDTALKCATNRAKYAYEIVGKLASTNPGEFEDGDEKKNVSEGASAKLNPVDPIEFVRPHITTVAEEEQKLIEFKVLLQRESILKPIFATIFYRTRKERQQAAPLRRLLAKAHIEYLQLQEAWNKNKLASMEELIKEKIPDVSEKEMEGFLRIFESHFDEEKAQELKLEKEKFATKKASERIRGKHNISSSMDSGNESVDTSLNQSQLEISEAVVSEKIAAMAIA